MVSSIHLPGAGVWTVFIQEMRRRYRVRGAIWTLVLSVTHLAFAFALQSNLLPLTEYSPPVDRTLSRVIMMEAITIPCLFLLLASVIGALVAPGKSEMKAIEAQLLTRLSAFDVCAGRLLAGHWNLIVSLTLSSIVWMLLNEVFRFEKPVASGNFGILFVFIIQLGAVLLVGAISMLFAIRVKRERSLGSGAAAGGIWTVFSLAGILMLNPLIQKMEDPTRFIDALLLFNPGASAASALHHDILRWNWIYERTVAPEYPFSYPAVWQSVLFFYFCAFALLHICAWRIKRGGGR